MSSSNYLTFGEFNNVEAQSIPPSQSFNDIQYENNTNNNNWNNNNDSSWMTDPYKQNNQPWYDNNQPPPRVDIRLPIRQHSPFPRNPYQIYPLAPPPVYNNPYYSQYTTPPSQQFTQETYTYPSQSTPINLAMTSTKSEEPQEPIKPVIHLSCIDVNDHISNCPMCSKYYQNNTGIYIGIIILLSFIILVFLLKSVLEIKPKS